MLLSISPIDGRYSDKTAVLAGFFSEFALIRYRVWVEVQYFKALCAIPLPQLKGVQASQLVALDRICENFSEADAARIKAIEKTTNHDVKAVEYFLKEAFGTLGLAQWKEYVHFGLTSQDINNTAVPLSIRDALEQSYLPALTKVTDTLHRMVEEWRAIPMLAHTHGQPASPTLLGKEIQVFAARLEAQMAALRAVPMSAKFGGATGNLNAHYVAYPDMDWHGFARQFVEKDLGLHRAFPTTQIEHYDHLAALFQAMSRIHTILIDLCRDVWTYISMEYFRQRTVAGEVGSSAMPHKVNPIDFENAEGNLGMANAVLGHLAEKLPVSRLQRDLTDSTVLRNVGVPFGHALIAFASIQKGLGKLLLNEIRLQGDLDNNQMVVAEAIQTILRREGYPEPYEALKALTRGKESVSREDIYAFIDGLSVSDAVKTELKNISPANYTGRAGF
ncbi:MAG: adenylosuccinate lyase [Saprospiraceae bacterium]|nr:adenylosuccinate lyase [Saprospiraceae bacterium]